MGAGAAAGPDAREWRISHLCHQSARRCRRPNQKHHLCQPGPLIYINIHAYKYTYILTSSSSSCSWLRRMVQVSCPEGLANLSAAYPEVQIVTSFVDPVLNSNKWIIPGLGDFGVSLYIPGCVIIYTWASQELLMSWV